MISRTSRPRIRRGAGTAVLLASALVLSACVQSIGSQSGMQAYYKQAIDWRDCGQGFQCGKLTVPLDYDRPGWKQIKLDVIRLPASEPDKRVGSLVVNPGGPGGSGVQFARAAKTFLPAKVRARFDVVGFDPRGVGGSAPVQCLSDNELDHYFSVDASPDSERERRTLVRESRQFAQGCAKHSRKLLSYVGTANAARDMDVLRAALGDDGLTYLGLSYGTLLGAYYAELFPENVRALVLDGAVDPSLSPRKMSIAQAKGFEGALRAFVADCVSRSACPLGNGSVEAGLNRLEEFFADLDAHPLPAGTEGGRQLTQALAKYGVASALYNERYWPYLRNALARALAGDGSGLLQLADALAGRQPDGSYTNMMEANLAINCVDEPMPEKISAYGSVARRADRKAPHFGEFIAWGTLPCAFWPVPPDPDVHIDGSGASPILVVGTTGDPATPYAWSKALASQLSSGVLLTRKGDGHTAYRQGNACIDKAINHYLISTDPPSPGKVCG